MQDGPEEFKAQQANYEASVERGLIFYCKTCPFFSGSTINKRLDPYTYKLNPGIRLREDYARLMP
jgi:hypothetical protein